MSWARLDDGWYDHPKATEAGVAACGLFARALSYSARHLTDGFVRDADALRLADNDASLCERLCATGFFERVEGGYQVHDFLHYNPSGKQVRRRRKREALRLKAYRERTSGERKAYARTVCVQGTGRDGSISSSESLPDSGTRARAKWKTVPASETLTAERIEVARGIGLTLAGAHWQWRKFSLFEFKRWHHDVDRSWLQWCMGAMERGESDAPPQGTNGRKRPTTRDSLRADRPHVPAGPPPMRESDAPPTKLGDLFRKLAAGES